jgi:phosphatidylserine/phosphatidylglycerophosphate/cardiolipin synthase-like enzyme
LGKRLIDLLADAAAKGLEIYAALFELNDPQLQTALLKLGMHAHVVLANGSVKAKGDDENTAARALLKGKIDLHDRMTAPRALAHNKFMVVCDSNDSPRWVWTGSLNWTETGLCTQANNSVYVDDPSLANEYLKQWNLLKAAGDETPKSLKVSDSQERQSNVQAAPVSLWFTPTLKQVDLAEARALINQAKHAILFLMFNPGPKDSLLNQIIATAQANAGSHELYVRGVLNQDPSTTANPLQIFRGKQTDLADFDVVLPASIDTATSWFAREMTRLAGTNAMVHSKVVIVDPFSEAPVVMTGSHNLGPKASGTNDENLLLIRNAPHLAAAYATNVMSIYNQYRWRYRRQTGTGKENWQGLKDNDTWQNGYLTPGSPYLKEIEFWVGD